MCCIDITVTKLDHLRCEMLCGGCSCEMREHGFTPKDALIQEKAECCSRASMAAAKHCPNASSICLLERRPLSHAGNRRSLSLCLACNSAACRTLGLILCFRAIPECGEVCGVASDIWRPLRAFTLKLHLAEQGSKCHSQSSSRSQRLGICELAACLRSFFALDKELGRRFRLGGKIQPQPVRVWRFSDGACLPEHLGSCAGRRH